MSKSYTSPLCSCIVCKKQFHIKSFHTHYQRIHDNSQTNYKNQTAKATKASQEKAKVRKSLIEYNYNLNPKLCSQCGNHHSFNTRNNKFCSHSCAATHSNSIRDYSKSRSGPPKGTKPSNYIPYTKISQCNICGRYHSGQGKSCSKECKSKVLSIAMNKRIDNGWNPQEHRNRSKPSYLESSFESWLLSNNKTDYVKNKTFRCNRKIYYGDFYFPELKILIELDGKQHLESIEYDSHRDSSILNHYGVYTIRISYNEFVSKTKLHLIESILL